MKTIHYISMYGHFVHTLNPTDDSIRNISRFVLLIEYITILSVQFTFAKRTNLLTDMIY